MTIFVMETPLGYNDRKHVRRQIESSTSRGAQRQLKFLSYPQLLRLQHNQTKLLLIVLEPYFEA
jgi:hypothetical protein